MLHLRAQLGGLVPVAACVLDRLGERCLGGVERPGSTQGVSEVDQQRGALGGLHREQPARPLEQSRRLGELVAIEHAPSGPSEEPPAAEGRGTPVGVHATERRAEEVRLLEVVADDLVVAQLRRADELLEPRREPRVEVGATLLRHGGIRDIPDEHVVEAEAVVALDERAVGPEQLLACEGEEDAAQPLGPLGREQGRDGAAMEQPALDGGALQHGPLARLQAVDARGEQRMDRRRHRLVAGVGIVGEHGEHLLDEERVPLGRTNDALPETRSHGEVADQSLDQVAGLGVAQRREGNEAGAGPGRRPGRARLEDIRPCEAEKQDRGASGEPEHVLEQVEQRRLGPVDVVDHDDERAGRGERLEEAAERPGGLLR